VRRRVAIAVLGVAALLLAVRAALPILVERYVDDVLDRGEHYEGSIDEVDLALWRGAYRIEQLRVDHTEKKELRPLIAAERIDLSLRWSALLRGALVGEVDAYGVVYNVVAAPPHDDDALAQSGDDPSLGERLSKLFPFSIDRLEVHDGEIHYRDPHREPKVDVALTKVHLLAENWTNVRDVERERFARAWLRAKAFDSARLVATLEADPWASPPAFRFAAVSERIRLTELNDFLRAYGGFDVADGQLSVYTEVSAEDGRYEGYVKPIVTELDVLSEEPGDDFLDRVWEGFVGVVAEVFENQFSGRQATRIPIEGTWGDPAPDSLLTAIGNVLYNAFIRALPPRLEHPKRLAGSK
jgi:hypothetical protein